MKKLDRTRIISFLLACFLAYLFLVFSYERVFDEFEYITLDFRYKMRPPQKVLDDVVIVEIGDDSINKLEKWPFPRNYHGLLIKALSAAGAKTIVFDVFFSEEKEGDEALAGSIKEAGNVFLPYVFDLELHNPDKTRIHAYKYAAPLLDIFQKACRGSGFINVVPDEDGNLRRVPAFIEYDGKLYPHLTVNAALNDLGYRFDEVKIVPEKEIIAGDFRIPLGEYSEMLVNYPSEWGRAFRHYSYVDIIQSYLADITGQEPALDLKVFKGSVCFVGLTATATPDTHPSPLEPLYPGVGVHASVYNGIMQGKFLIRLNRWWNLLILVIMWLLAGLVTLKVRRKYSVLSVISLMIAFVAFAFFFSWAVGIWVDVFYPLFTMVLIYIIFTFRKYLAEMQKREVMEKELDIAKDIQQSFLPLKLPEIAGIEIAAGMKTAKQVGGDLYDVVELYGNNLGAMIGDVSGKGVPAALFMARVASEFKIFSKQGTANEVLKMINEHLLEGTSSNLFVTVAYLIFDTNEKKVYIASGGHLPTVLLRPDGEIALLDVEEGMPLGLVEGEYTEEELEYRPGSTFVLYTDGVTEAMDRDEEMFGQDRLVDLVKKMKGRSAKEIVDAVHQAVSEFSGKAPQHDDITVIAIKT
ncbi:MAG: CHASE2 domain-containing protein [Candidatus Omnitrophota bacterium]|jgi:CHASE2 domain-containing sensor protein